MSKPRTVCFVAGARPNFPKIAPILAALKGDPSLQPLLVHTGQHYDPELSSMFFEDLGIAEPDWMLGVGSGSHAVQTAQVMIEFERRCLEQRPDAVVVVGDVNSTVACALVAAKLQIPVAHVEAGLRSGDRSMPEELNRLATDVLADILYTHCDEADENLSREGIPQERIQQVGNTMIDSLLRLRPRAERPTGIPEELLEHRGYGLVTLHRPALVDSREQLAPMLEALARISEDLPLLYPVHPRTLARMRDFELISSSAAESSDSGSPLRFGTSGLHLCGPKRYLQFLWLMDHARLVITDSGGIQEETTVLGVPCLTVRENTERAVTIHEGTNQLIGLTPERLLEAASDCLHEPFPEHHAVPRGWDGHAGERIARHLATWLGERPRAS